MIRHSLTYVAMWYSFDHRKEIYDYHYKKKIVRTASKGHDDALTFQLPNIVTIRS
jgi:hypothetical protein